MSRCYSAIILCINVGFKYQLPFNGGVVASHAKRPTDINSAESLYNNNKDTKACSKRHMDKKSKSNSWIGNSGNIITQCTTIQWRCIVCGLTCRGNMIYWGCRHWIEARQRSAEEEDPRHTSGVGLEPWIKSNRSTSAQHMARGARRDDRPTEIMYDFWIPDSESVIYGDTKRVKRFKLGSLFMHYLHALMMARSMRIQQDGQRRRDSCRYSKSKH